MQKKAKDLIIQTLKEKSCMKQDVYRKTFSVFQVFKSALFETVTNLEQEMKGVDDNITFHYKSKGDYEAEIKVAGDILIFNMHTNIFDFDKTHPIWNTSYTKEDPFRSFCGMISIYNFLSDSLKYNRNNDLGYLVARVFINREKHYFVEGKRQLGFLYNDFVNSVIDKNSIQSIIESAILYSLDFDLLTPSYDTMKEVTVSQMLEISEALQIKTGKRLGFRFQADSDNVE
jgi:hypothetical protein